MRRVERTFRLRVTGDERGHTMTGVPSLRQVHPRRRICCFRIPCFGRNVGVERIGTERFRWRGLRPVVAALRNRQLLERDSNPRLSVCNRCSTRLSYPAVGGPDSNRRPRFRVALPDRATALAKNPRAILGIRRGRAARTGRIRNPHRCEPSIDSSHCRRPTAILSRHRFFRRPAEASRHAAHSGQNRPVTDRPWSAHRRSSSLLFRLAPDASERKRHRNTLVRSFANAPEFQAPERKCPRVGTRGHSRRLGRSGWPISLREDQPGMKPSSMHGRPAYRLRAATPRLSRRSRLHGWLWKERVMSLSWWFRVVRMGAHDTPEKKQMQTLFFVLSENIFCSETK